MRQAAPIVVVALAIAGCTGPATEPDVACHGACPVVLPSSGDAFEVSLAVAGDQVAAVHTPFMGSKRALEVLERSGDGTWMAHRPDVLADPVLVGCSQVIDSVAAFDGVNLVVVAIGATDDLGAAPRQMFWYRDNEIQAIEPPEGGGCQTSSASIPDYSQLTPGPDGRPVATWRHAVLGSGSFLDDDEPRGGVGIAYADGTRRIIDLRPAALLPVATTPSHPCAGQSTTPKVLLHGDTVYIASIAYRDGDAAAVCAFRVHGGEVEMVAVGSSGWAYPGWAWQGGPVLVAGMPAGDGEIPTLYRWPGAWTDPEAEAIPALMSDGTTTPAIVAWPGAPSGLAVTAYVLDDDMWSFRAWNGTVTDLTDLPIAAHGAGIQGGGHYTGLAVGGDGLHVAWVAGLSPHRIVQFTHVA